MKRPGTKRQQVFSGTGSTDGASVFYTLNDIIALGAPDSSLDAVVAGNAARLALKVTPDPEPDQHLFVRADQYSFVRQGVPSAFIFEGEEAEDPGVDGKKFMEQWVATRYQAPSDVMNQPLNLDAALELSKSISWWDMTSRRIRSIRGGSLGISSARISKAKRAPQRIPV